MESRDNVGRFAPGHRGGPGRPANGVSSALRRLGDPEAIATYVLTIINDPNASKADRRWAIEFFTDRTDGKPTQTSHLEVTTAPAADHEVDFSRLTPEQLDQYILLCDLMAGQEPDVMPVAAPMLQLPAPAPACCSRCAGITDDDLAETRAWIAEGRP